MRDYLYLWHDVESRSIVASGLEFRDFLPALARSGGVLLIDYPVECGEWDAASSFEYVPADKLEMLAAETTPSCGNLVWADYPPQSVPSLGDEDVMQLLFVAHKGRLAGTYPILKSTGGRFLAYGHDDGWYLRLWYAARPDVERLLDSIIPPDWARPEFEAIWRGTSAYWLQAGQFDIEERTYDIDSVQNRQGWKAR